MLGQHLQVTCGPLRAKYPDIFAIFKIGRSANSESYNTLCYCCEMWQLRSWQKMKIVSLASTRYEIHVASICLVENHLFIYFLLAFGN